MRMLMRVLGITALVLIAGAARASDDGACRLISRCFHPFSDYVDGVMGDPYPIGEHTLALDGYVRYRQLDNKVRRMPFQLQMRAVDGERMYRVIPDDEHNTGDFGPSTSCVMRNWQTK